MKDPPGGRIRLLLTLADGRVTRAQVLNSRPPDAASLLVGQQAQALPEAVGRLFSLCGRAQTIAALGALESAMGIETPPEVAAGRDALRLAEIATQTAMRLALHWPMALGLPPAPGLVRLCVEIEKALERALGAQWSRPGGAQGAPGEEALRLLRDLDDEVARFLQGGGLQARIGALGLSAFGALPDGMAPEGGPLARLWDDPQVAAVRARHGLALAARLAASEAEMAQSAGQIRDSLAEAGEAPARARAPVSGSTTGAASVICARGPLGHEIALGDGIVTHFRISAPTEENFRPGGPVTAGLVGAGADGIELAARLHVLAIDPCVEFSLEVADA